MLWQAQILLQGIIDGESNRSGWHNFDIVQAQACEECSSPLLLDNQAEALQGGVYPLSFQLVFCYTFQLLQPLHLQAQMMPSQRLERYALVHAQGTCSIQSTKTR